MKIFEPVIIFTLCKISAASHSQLQSQKPCKKKLCSLAHTKKQQFSNFNSPPFSICILLNIVMAEPSLYKTNWDQQIFICKLSGLQLWLRATTKQLDDQTSEMKKFEA